jgi:hypothetical protein
MWPILIIGAVAYLLYQQGNNLQEQLSYSPAGVRFYREGTSIKLDYKLDIENRSNQRLKIDSIDGKVFYQGKEVGTFLMANPATVEPLKTTQLTINTRFSSIDVLSAIYSNWQNKQKPVLTLTGGIQTALGRVPISETFGINI